MDEQDIYFLIGGKVEPCPYCGTIMDCSLVSVEDGPEVKGKQKRYNVVIRWTCTEEYHSITLDRVYPASYRLKLPK